MDNPPDPARDVSALVSTAFAGFRKPVLTKADKGTVFAKWDGQPRGYFELMIQENDNCFYLSLIDGKFVTGGETCFSKVVKITIEQLKKLYAKSH